MSGDIEGRAVIDGRADNRETQGNVNGILEIHQLHRNVALIMVHGDHEIKFSANRFGKKRVCGKGAMAVDASSLGRLNRREN